MWTGLVGNNNSSTKWTKNNLRAEDPSTRTHGQYFGLVKEIYISLTRHSYITYVLYMVNRMTARSHVQGVGIDVFECAHSGTVERLKSRMSLQDSVDQLSEGITRRDMTLLGLASYRQEWNLFENAYSWTAGDAKVKLTRKVAAVEKNMPPGLISEYENGIMYIDPILKRTGIPAQFLTS